MNQHTGNLKLTKEKVFVIFPNETTNNHENKWKLLKVPKYVVLLITL